MVETPFAFAVRRLARDDVTVTQIAARLVRSEADVMEALRMLALPLPGEQVAAQSMPAVDLDRVPKKWQHHYGPGRR